MITLEVRSRVETGDMIGLDPPWGLVPFVAGKHKTCYGYAGEVLIPGNLARTDQRGPLVVWTMVRPTILTEINPEREKTRAALREEYERKIAKHRDSLDSYERTWERMKDSNPTHGLKDVINVIKAEVEAYEGFLASLG